MVALKHEFVLYISDTHGGKAYNVNFEKLHVVFSLVWYSFFRYLKESEST